MSNFIRRSAISFLTLLLALCLAAIAVPAQTNTENARSRMSAPQTHIIKEVRHELLTLPYYDVFDWLEYEVLADGTVILRGQVVSPPDTKSRAEARVKAIDGVKRVINEIEVLPVSPSDDRLRRALYRAIFKQNSPLFRYGLGAVPSIHIVVKRGRATLKGIVATEADRNLAYIRARSVSGLFEVTNHLRVEGEEELY